MRHRLQARFCFFFLLATALAPPSIATAASTLFSSSYQLHGGTMAAAAGVSENALGTTFASAVHLGGLAAGTSTGAASGIQLVGGLVGSPTPIPEPSIGLLWFAGFFSLLTLARRRMAVAQPPMACLAAILTIGLIVPTAAHAVPHDTAYQGRLTDNLGDPLAGPVDIDLAIYESMVEIPGEVALYSEEHTGVELDGDGSFNVLIGTGTVIVGSYDPSLFQGTNRYLQVTIGDEVLEPRQPISSVPFALMAGEVEGAPNLVTEVATIQTQVGDLPPGGVTIATHIQNLEAAVAAAENAVDAAQSAVDTVVADLAASDAEQAALIGSLGPALYASAPLRTGAFESLQAAQSSSGPLIATTTTSINLWNQLLLIRCLDDYCHASTQIEVAHGDFYPWGECIEVSMNGTCYVWAPVFWDITDMSVAVGSDGMPIMVYRHPYESDSLSFLKCGNESCNAGTYDQWGFLSSWSGNTLTLIGGATELSKNALAVGGDGLPVIASFSGSDLIITHCQDINCSASSQVTLGSGPHSLFAELSMKIGANGFPAITYFNASDSTLDFIQCTNSTCSSNSTAVLDSSGHSTKYLSLAIDSLGHPSIVYLDDLADTLKFVHCLDAGCASASATTVVLASANSISYTNLIYTPAGNAVISYVESGALSYLSCLDETCSTAETTAVGSSPPNPGSGRRIDMLANGPDDLVSSYIGSSGVEIYARTGSRMDEVLALIAAAQESAAQAQASAEAIAGSCGTLVAASSCPVGTVADGPKCDTIPVGSFCEGDGECGTDAELNNCGSSDWYLRTGN